MDSEKFVIWLRHVFLFQFSPAKSKSRDDITSPYSLSPISNKSLKILRSPRKAARKISKIPFKVTHKTFIIQDIKWEASAWS